MTGKATEKHASKERFNPYDRKSLQQRVASETPSEIIRLLSRQPPTKSKFVESSQPSQASQSDLDTINEYVMKKPEHEIPLRLSKTKSRFKEADYIKANSDQRYDHIFKKKNRHTELAEDALSVISTLTTTKYSRFDRLFADEPNTTPAESPRFLQFEQPKPSRNDSHKLQNLEQTAPIFERTITPSQQQEENYDRDTMDSLFGDDGTPSEATRGPLFHDIAIPTSQVDTQKSLFHEIAPATQQERPNLLVQTQTSEQTQTQTTDHSKPTSSSLHESDTRFQETLLQTQMEMEDDNFSYGGGPDDYDFDGEEPDQSDTELNAPIDEMDADGAFDGSEYGPISSSTETREPVEPRKKIVVQGDSFMNKLVEKGHLGYPMVANGKVKSLFQSFIDTDKAITVPNSVFSEMTNLFFYQMVDDLKSYKANQPEHLQGEINQDDMILLMKRQRIITDKQSLEAIAHKYLPKEYSDLVGQSALAYNRLFPTSAESNARFKAFDDIDDEME